MKRQAELWIGARHVSVRGLKRNWRGAESFDMAYTAELASDGALLQTCLEVLAQLPSTQNLRVIVSDSYCRYQVLIRPDGTRSRTELESAIRARFQASFGVDADDWILRTDSAANARQDFLCALRRTTVYAIEQAALEHGSRIQSIVPLWIWSAKKAKAPRQNCWLLAAEANVITAGWFQGGRCIGVRSHRQLSSKLNSGEELGNILLRESALYTESSAIKKLVIFGKALAKQAQHDVGQFQIETWQLPDNWDIQEGAG